jgi:hypothetical protein
MFKYPVEVSVVMVGFAAGAALVAAGLTLAGVLYVTGEGSTLYPVIVGVVAAVAMIVGVVRHMWPLADRVFEPGRGDLALAAAVGLAVVGGFAYGGSEMVRETQLEELRRDDTSTKLARFAAARAANIAKATRLCVPGAKVGDLVCVRAYTTADGHSFVAELEGPTSGLEYELYVHDLPTPVIGGERVAAPVEAKLSVMEGRWLITTVHPLTRGVTVLARKYGTGPKQWTEQDHNRLRALTAAEVPDMAWEGRKVADSVAAAWLNAK